MNEHGAGLYGKLPSFGDFVTRRLPTAFTDRWDSWLQKSIAASRLSLGDAWLERYLEAPVWRFLLGSGVISEQAYAGVLVPSVDRVGRYFPLTLAMAIGVDVDAPTTFAACRDWYRDLESLGLEALEAPLDFERFDARLAATPLPPASFGGGDDDDTVPIALRQPRHLGMELPDGLTLDGSAGGWREMIAQLCKPVCLWSTGSNEIFGRVYLASEKLPGSDQFSGMLDGAWEAHAWDFQRAVETSGAASPTESPAP